MRRTYLYLWVKNFFGLPEGYKEYLYEEVLYLSYISEGSISYTEAYNMPSWLRKFNLRKIKEFKNKEKQQIDSLLPKNNITLKNNNLKPKK